MKYLLIWLLTIKAIISVAQSPSSYPDSLVIKLPLPDLVLYRVNAAKHPGMAGGYLIPHMLNYRRLGLGLDNISSVWSLRDGKDRNDTLWDKGSWGWVKAGMVKVTLKKAVYTFNVIQYGRYYYLIPPDQERTFLNDLVARRRKFKSDKPYSNYGRILTPDDITGMYLSKRYYAREFDDG